MTKLHVTGKAEMCFAFDNIPLYTVSQPEATLLGEVSYVSFGGSKPGEIGLNRPFPDQTILYPGVR